MQPSSTGETFGDALGRILTESHTSIRRLERLSGVSRRTLENWLHGQIRRPRHWEPVIRVARALHLPESETDALLRAAGLPPLAALQATHLVGPQTDLLAAWQPRAGAAPSQRTASPAPHNLPASATLFLGRRHSLQTLLDLLRQPDARLIMVTGLGGAGKTRLALEAARAAVDWFDHGVYFVSLDSAGDAAALWDRIVAELNIPRDVRTPTDRLVLDYLRRKRLLLIFDNIDHMPALAPLLGEMVRQAPRLKLLVTSRRTLDLRAAHILSLDGLSVAEGTDSPAYQLFLATAQRRVPGYTPTASETADILAICEAVEGLPLALELAAAWVDVLHPARILARLQANLSGVHHAAADRPERQHNLWNVFDSSFQALPGDAQAAAMRLSVLCGSFTASAALAIAGCEPESLRALKQASLIRRQADGRLAIHALVRQYLVEQAARAGLDQPSLLAFYMEYYMTWLAEQGWELRESMSAAAVEQIAGEWHHVQIAWWLAVENGRSDLLDAAIDLLIFFEARSAWIEGRAFFKATRDRLVVDDRYLQARLDEAQAILAIRVFDYQPAIQLAQSALATFQALGVDPETNPAGAYARLVVWAVEYSLGQHDTARATVDAVYEAAGIHLAKFAEMNYLLLNGVRSAARGDWPGAHDYYRVALEASLPDGYHVPNVRLFLGQSYAQLGDIDAARQQFELARHAGHQQQIYAAVVGGTFEICYLATPSPSAADCLQALSELAHAVSSPGVTGSVAIHLAVVCLTQGLVAKAGYLAWTGLSLLWVSTEPPARAASLLMLGQAYLAFRQLPIAIALLSMVPSQTGVDNETRLMAEGLLAMLGGAGRPPPPGDPPAMLKDILVQAR